MKVLKSHLDVPAELQNAVLAIGNFDGVHRGHQYVLQKTIEQARKKNVPAGVMSFAPHPRTVFQPDTPFFPLSSFDQKIQLFSALGLDFAAILPFDKALYSRPAKAFIKDILLDGFAVSHVITGYNFFFGKGRDGNPDVMRAQGQRLGFDVGIIAPVGEPDAAAENSFSSSKVRRFLQNGEMRLAADMLGYWWRVDGFVAAGAGRGDGMGYPTANIPLLKGQDLAHGIYAVRVSVAGQIYGGAAYLGTRPTFDDGAPVLEIYIFDFSAKIYGKNISVAFIEYLRRDEKFGSEAALTQQMNKDCARAEAVLSKLSQDDPFAGSPVGAAFG